MTRPTIKPLNFNKGIIRKCIVGEIDARTIRNLNIIVNAIKKIRAIGVPIFVVTKGGTIQGTMIIIATYIIRIARKCIMCHQALR